jgi:predicted ribosome quality control (RQC) complex YloA/Tae2 family protein
MRRPQQRRQPGFDRVAQIDIDSGAGIGFEAVIHLFVHYEAQLVLEASPSAKRF